MSESSSYDSSQEIRQPALPLDSQDSDSATCYLQGVRHQQNQLPDVFMSKDHDQASTPSALDEFMLQIDAALLQNVKESMSQLKNTHAQLSSLYLKDPSSFCYDHHLTNLQDSVLNPRLVCEKQALLTVLAEKEPEHWVSPSLSVLLHVDSSKAASLLPHLVSALSHFPVLNYNQTLWCFCLLTLVDQVYPQAQHDVIALCSMIHLSLSQYPLNSADHKEYVAMLSVPLAAGVLLRRQHSYLYSFY